MQYYRCECGQREAWGSMPPASCDPCPHCGKTLATSPSGHHDPIPHNLVTKYDENTGKPYQVCTRCWYQEPAPTETERS